MVDAFEAAGVPKGNYLDLVAIGRSAVLNGVTIDSIVAMVTEHLRGYDESPETLQRLAAEKAASFVTGLFAIHKNGEPVCINYPDMNVGEKE